ncbi:fasciclin domain-containing protein [Flavobacterium sp. SUN052]|uniref:fasciclin domain-containing protein n=1 Tax=Flavobacterium sp. SUN052 TaxID=3002441 RepID=UPI00237EC481|nr:fasciclin domain-containing protein [Flavobacterium sp. SUN052]MEC4005340.1 fasciclin domain-containing protein [Flavobacterium sp. SUN052]
MKHFSLLKKSSLVIAIIFIATSIVGCSMEEEANAKKSSITGVVQLQSDLSILSIALDKTNLSATLGAQGTYTLFAPTDAAFNTFLATNGFSDINAVPTAILKEILLNHVIGQTINSVDLPSSGYIKTLATGTVSTNTLSMYVNKSSGVVLNDNAKVTSANVLASNGIIHIVDAVIGLPTVTDHIIANPNLTSLVGVLTGTGQPDFIATFSSTGPFTVFAPINAAFTSLNSEISGGVAGVSASDMTKILQYHVVSTNILSTDLMEGEVVSTLQAPQSFTVLLSTGPKLQDVNNRKSSIVTTDIQCSNGVIHLLSKVLLPTL